MRQIWIELIAFSSCRIVNSASNSGGVDAALRQTFSCVNGKREIHSGNTVTNSDSFVGVRQRLVALPQNRRPRFPNQKVQVRPGIRPEHMIDVELPVAAV